MSNDLTGGEKVARTNELHGEVQRLTQEVNLLRRADKARLEQLHRLEEAHGRVCNELAAYKHEARSDNWVSRDMARIGRSPWPGVR